MKFNALIGMSALGLLVSACSGGESDSSSTSAPSSSETTTETATPEAGASAEEPVTYASLTGDAAKGKTAFMQCRTCHVMDEGQNRVGPSLHNIVGAKAGAVSGFNYSPANANSGITWTEEKLFEYLADPQEIVPKTKMIFAGMPDAQRRADIIAYMKDPS